MHISNFQNYSDIKRSNISILLGYGLMNVILVICYLLEVLKGSRTISYYIIFCILALLPFLVTVAEYKYNPESEKIKIMLPIGFGIFYCFIKSAGQLSGSTGINFSLKCCFNIIQNIKATFGLSFNFSNYFSYFFFIFLC